MTYLEAIYTCDHIDDAAIETEAKLQAIEKILSMATINAVKKDILLKVIRWFFDTCVEVTEVPTETDDVSAADTVPTGGAS